MPLRQVKLDGRQSLLHIFVEVLAPESLGLAIGDQTKYLKPLRRSFF